MTRIEIHTTIHASAVICFDLARSVDAHLTSLQHTNERVIAGRKSGLCEIYDVITWEAKHFGITQHLTVKITKIESPHFFEDIMIKGAFKSMQHQHYFEEKNGATIMKDVFAYETPGWILGRLFDMLILKTYMTKLIAARNLSLKTLAEEQARNSL